MSHIGTIFRNKIAILKFQTIKMATSKHILSKSTFMYGCQCPLRLYMHKFESKYRNPIDKEHQSIFATGTNIGLLAQGLFPDGVNSEPLDPFSYHLAVEKTKTLIEGGAKVIYEACFNFNGILCALDILVNQNGKWYAYEVKGSTSVKETFIQDAALQYYIITNAGIVLENIYLVYLNNKYVRVGDLDIQQLFSKTSILAEVKGKQPYIKTQAKVLMELVVNKTKPSISPGEHCFKPYECDFTAYCWRNEVEEEKIPAEKFCDKDYIESFLSEFSYPLCFLDFETIMPAIPEFDYSRPYQQLTFQYSLHIQEKKKGPLKHLEFLGDGILDPRKALINQLIKDLGRIGSIVVWNQSFENSRLKEMAIDFPEFHEPVQAILKRVVDLMIPFRKKSIVHPDFKGSYSIKKVLPVLVPELNYSNLDVQDGGTASAMYYELKSQPKVVQKIQRTQLLEYCKLDTLAMVKILEAIQ